MSRRKIIGGVILAATLLPATAFAGSAWLQDTTEIHAGPDYDYPTLDIAYAGDGVEVHGCLSDYSWCDVGYRGLRGWIAGDELLGYYQDRRQPIAYIGPYLGYGILSFSFDSYWDRHYRSRDFYRQRTRWQQFSHNHPNRRDGRWDRGREHDGDRARSDRDRGDRDRGDRDRSTRDRNHRDRTERDRWSNDRQNSYRQQGRERNDAVTQRANQGERHRQEQTQQGQSKTDMVRQQQNQARQQQAVQQRAQQEQDRAQGAQQQTEQRQQQIQQRQQQQAERAGRVERVRESNNQRTEQRQQERQQQQQREQRRGKPGPGGGERND